jgi:magnesium-transporting ATPase (P-type)
VIPDNENQLMTNSKQRNGVSNHEVIDPQKTNYETSSSFANPKGNVDLENHINRNQGSTRKKIRRRRKINGSSKSQSPQIILLLRIVKPIAFGLYVVLLFVSMAKLQKDELTSSLIYNLFAVLFLFFIKIITDITYGKRVFNIVPFLFRFHSLLLVFHTLLTIWFTD